MASELEVLQALATVVLWDDEVKQAMCQLDQSVQNYGPSRDVHIKSAETRLNTAAEKQSQAVATFLDSSKSFLIQNGTTMAALGATFHERIRLLTFIPVTA